ncbi:hypothetical protein B0T18DRAFT_201956 [Schizothecium vesticola]|uniref:Uncharacterized protein n=1 Tax=Schizothecium vesticola TaxID=314040 RepID=A0AA40BTE9_9PEZI|nr:hypothetical protein B0T18DRAFT_201956 [Schizothecium vesticola]
MKSAVVFTLAMRAAAMHIPWLSQNDNNRQAPIMVMTEENAVMNSPHDETRMPSGQGFHGMGSGGDEIDVHVHLDVSHRGANTMVSLDTPSRPDNPMDATGAHRIPESPSGMRTTAESMNDVTLSSDPGSNAMPAGSSLSTETDNNMMPGGSSSFGNPQTDEMPRGGAMDVSQATPKGMQTMGSGTGMDGHEVCKQLEPDVPIYFQCPIPAYVKIVGESGFCCYWSSDSDTGIADSRSGMMMSGKKANFDL